MDSILIRCLRSNRFDLRHAALLVTLFILPTIAWASTALQYVPVAPCRIADTRLATGPFGGPILAAKSGRDFFIPQSACKIPSTAMAYALNVTVVPPRAPFWYLTLWPSGTGQPYVSTLNSYDGRVKANAAIIGAGYRGGVSVYVTQATHLILDISGYFVPQNTPNLPRTPLEFFPVTPCRVADTRSPANPLTAGESRPFPVRAPCGIPSTAVAYSLNITAVPHGRLDILTAWATGQIRPGSVSTLNATTGQITANAAIVNAGTGGEVSIYVTQAADVIIDVNGYFAPGPGGLSLYTVPPCRVRDTRSQGYLGAFRGTITVQVQGGNCGVPPGDAYVLNATVVPKEPMPFLTLWATGSAQPFVSTLNAYDGLTTSNMAIVSSTNGSIDAFSDGALIHLVLDISGYFAPAPVP